MSIYDIHSCSKICAQNADLKQKLLHSKRRIEELQRQLDDIAERQQGKQQSARPLVQNAAVQTDPKPWMFRSHTQPAKQQDKEKITMADIAKVNKVIEMHSQLLKRYDKEVKLNMTYADNISDLNVRLAETEHKLREEKDKVLQLERELVIGRSKIAKPAEVEDPVLREVVKERNKLARENKKLKGELKGLDHNFFDEIEDLKFALLQSAKLSSQYEKQLHSICSQHGIPYPKSEFVLNKRKL